MKDKTEEILLNILKADFLHVYCEIKNKITIALMISQNSITIIQQIFDRILTLCKECNLPLLPPKLGVSDIFGFICYGTPTLPLQNYIKALEELRSKIFEYSEVEDEYNKLEEVLQKNETEIRRHIGVDQQLRLYIDTIKAQFQESENERLELVENSKRMIQQLKQENEKLHQKATGFDLKQKNNSSRIKMIRNSNRERARTDHSSSLNINNLHKFHTENPYFSPIKEKNKGSDFKIMLTERYETEKKKKFGESKKKAHQSFTLMAYAGQQKKRKSKDKTNTKKGLINFSNMKEDYDEIELHQRTNSDKKVNRVEKSHFSLSSFNSKDHKKTTPKGKYKCEVIEEKINISYGNTIEEQ